jgi:hypothetical protein
MYCGALYGNTVIIHYRSLNGGLRQAGMRQGDIEQRRQKHAACFYYVFIYAEVNHIKQLK